jgi:hypothetical protein
MRDSSKNSYQKAVDDDKMDKGTALYTARSAAPFVGAEMKDYRMDVVGKLEEEDRGEEHDDADDAPWLSAL